MILKSTFIHYVPCKGFEECICKMKDAPQLHEIVVNELTLDTLITQLNLFYEKYIAILCASCDY